MDSVIASLEMEVSLQAGRKAAYGTWMRLALWLQIPKKGRFVLIN